MITIDENGELSLFEATLRFANDADQACYGYGDGILEDSLKDMRKVADQVGPATYEEVIEKIAVVEDHVLSKLSLLPLLKVQCADLLREIAIAHGFSAVAELYWCIYYLFTGETENSQGTRLWPIVTSFKLAELE